ncbi:MAG: acyl-CoA dehydrogenase family protein [Candidatus Thiodiazotropha sp.]|jgi:alkylation response protein AidB-like acyl-CoA dehydrogenase
MKQFVPDIGPAPDHTIGTAKERLKACGKAGLFGHAVPESFGGLGDGFDALCRDHELLGNRTRDPGLILAINAHIWGSIFPLLRFGTDSQKERYLPGLVRGELLGGHAITEPTAGSDTAAMLAKAIATKDGFTLNGCKRYITNTPIADLLVIYAKLDGAITAFLVHHNDPGATFANGPSVDGCATASMGEIILDDCHIPADRLLGKAGSGGILIQLALELERAFIFSGVVGIMQWQLENVIDFARNRRVKGGALSDCQVISHRIAEMKLRLETIRLWVARCSECCDNKKRIAVESAATKWYASEGFLSSSLDAVQIFGTKGLESEHSLLVRDAMAGRLFSGSTEIQKNIIAAMLGVGN